MKRTIPEFYALLIVLTVLTVACSGNGQEKTGGSGVQLPGDDNILVRVNGSGISQYDLNQAIQRTLGPMGLKTLEDEARRNVLESLVAARAISQVQSKALSAAQVAELDKKTAAYREQLLVKMYLAEHAPADPVSRQMVEEYYNGHPEQFGGKTVRTYEMITSEDSLSDAGLDRVLKDLNNPGRIEDWPAAVENIKHRGLPLIYRRATGDAKVLTAQLRDLILSLKAGQSSDLTFIDGKLYAVRVVEVKSIPARPLSEVSTQIRKMLLPVQLKKAVKQASDQVLGNATVEYAD